MEPAISRVWIRDASPANNPVTLDEFLEFGPEFRARLILEGQVEFIDEGGYVMADEEAMSGLRDSWVAPAVVQTQSATEERRQFPRYPLVRPLWVRRQEAPTEQIAIARDISQGGIAFRSRDDYARGERVIVGWPPGESRTHTFWLSGRVVRAEAGAGALFSEFPQSIAVEFEASR